MSLVGLHVVHVDVIKENGLVHYVLSQGINGKKNFISVNS